MRSTTSEVATSGRVLRVVWQHPGTREFHEVGVLRFPAEAGGDHTFQYCPLLPDGFRPFRSFPNTDGEYRSRALFPFFANRVMTARRADYPAHLAALGLTTHEATPAELLARTGGSRVTDTVQVVPEPTPTPDGGLQQPFLVSGIRHLPGAAETVASLQAGDELRIVPQPDNEYDPRALLLDAQGMHVGWIPSFLLDEVHKWCEDGRAVRCVVERANGPDVPWHLRLLCLLRVAPSTF